MAAAGPCARIVPLFGSGAAPSFVIPDALTGAWSRVGGAARAHLCAFLGEAAIASGVVIAPADAPATFAADLATGGAGLRAAFPGLTRRVAAIDIARRRIAIRIECEGTHDGAFFGFVMPTRRVVHFAERHDLRVEDDRVVEDRLAIDLRAIVRQLARGADQRS